jgi:hypothetical protein
LIHAVEVLLLLAHSLLQLAEHGGGGGELIHPAQPRGARLAEGIQRSRILTVGADESPRVLPGIRIGAKLLGVAQVA